MPKALASARSRTLAAKTLSRTLKLTLKPGHGLFVEVSKWDLSAPGAGSCNFCPSTDAKTLSRTPKMT